MEEVKCPKCGSTQISANKKGFNTGRAIAGGLLTGNIWVAAASGGIGMNAHAVTSGRSDGISRQRRNMRNSKEDTQERTFREVLYTSVRAVGREHSSTDVLSVKDATDS